MKKVEFPHTLKAWDRYEAFHVGVGKREFHRLGAWASSQVVLFDTGELIAQHTHHKPYARGDYPLVGISLLTTRDIQLYTPEGEPVPKTWLNYEGQQCVMVDWESGRAVGLGYSWDRRESANMPTRFSRNCGGYIAGAGKLPVGQPIKAYPCNRKAGYSEQEKEYLANYIKVAKCAMLLTDHNAVRSQYWGRNVAVPPARLFAVQNWQHLDHWEQTRLYHCGVGRREIEYPYLLTSPDGSAYRV